MRSFLLIALVIVLAVPGRSETDPLATRVRHSLAYAQQQYLHTLAELKDTIVYPRSSPLAGGWKHVEGDDWTSGFFPGTLWYLAEWSGDSTLRAAAIRFTDGLESQQYNSGTHDVGFMMYCSYGNGYRISPSRHYKDVLLQSAKTLAGRFRPEVGCIKSWDWSPDWGFPVIVDNMMNLELLFWASKNGGGDTLRSLAIRHAETTLKHHFRPDGGTYHVVDFDTLSGRVIRKQTHQGFSDESVWARGQAWALYGFTMTYRETRDRRFLDAAVRAADFFLSHLPPDHIPYWDFNAPDIPHAAKDASAAAIAASGLLELAGFVTGQAQRDAYTEGAAAILTSLTASPYLSEGSPSEGVLNHCTGNHPGGLEIDVSLIYADYYVVEAMLRYLHRLN